MGLFCEVMQEFSLASPKKQLIVLFHLTVFLSLAPLTSATEPPVRILTSLNPLSLILKEAFGDLVNVSPLLDPTRSPHLYTLKPSDIQQIEDAEIFVWVGPGMESFLPKVLKKAKSKHEVELLSLIKRDHPDLLLTFKGESVAADRGRTDLPVRMNSIDSHIWMSKTLALEIASQVSVELKALLPEKQALIQQRLQHFSQTLATLDVKIELPGITLVSYHSAFNYLARELAQTIQEVIVNQADLSPGAKHFSRLSQKLQQSPHCLINEPQFRNSRIIQKLGALAGTVVELDPMGGGAGSYSELYRGWTTNMAKCGQALFT